MRALATPLAAQTVGLQRCSYPTGASQSACLTPYARLRLSDADATRVAYVLDRTVHLMNLTSGMSKLEASTVCAPLNCTKAWSFSFQNPW